MPVQGPCQPDNYILARNFKFASRLNYEHYLWHETLGYELHPTILQSIAFPDPQTHTPKIADIACGTAIWLRRLAQELPRAELDGFDISLVQCPPAQWLPKNIRLREWDLFSEPSEEMLGAYDVVHVRLLFVVVRDGDPRPVIRNLMRLLKPGGYLQWDELDVSRSFILRAEEGISAPVVERKLAYLENVGKWVVELAKCMEGCGVKKARFGKFEREKIWRRRFSIIIWLRMRRWPRRVRKESACWRKIGRCATSRGKGL